MMLLKILKCWKNILIKQWIEWIKNLKFVSMKHKDLKDKTGMLLNENKTINDQL